MNTTTITFPIDPIIKKRAKEKIEKQGYNLDFLVGSLVNEFLTNVIKSENEDIILQIEKPSDYLKKTLKKARESRKAGKGSPIFDNSKDHLKWLEDQGI